MVLTDPEDVAGLPLSLLKLTAEAAAAAESTGASKEESRFYILIILYCMWWLISIRIKQVNFWEHNDWAFHQDKWNCLSYVGIYNKQVSIEQGFTVQHFSIQSISIKQLKEKSPTI